MWVQNVNKVKYLIFLEVLRRAAGRSITKSVINITVARVRSGSHVQRLIPKILTTCFDNINKF